MTALAVWLLYLYVAAGAAIVSEAWYDGPHLPPPTGWRERAKMVLIVLLAVAVWPALVAILGWPTSRWTRR